MNNWNGMWEFMLQHNSMHKLGTSLKDLERGMRLCVASVEYVLGMRLCVASLECVLPV